MTDASRRAVSLRRRVRASADRPGHAVRLGGRPRGQPLRRAWPSASWPRAGTASRSSRPRATRRSCGTRDARSAPARREPLPAAAVPAAAVLAVGEVLPIAPGRAAPRCRSTSRATIEELLDRDAVRHRATSTSRGRRASPARRCAHSRALNVGTFHAPTERVVATQVARKLVELVFGRLDARHRRASTATRRPAATASSPPTTSVVAAGRRAGAPRAPRGRPAARCGSSSSTTRSAPRCGSSCARCAGSTLTLEWTATVVSARGPSSSTPLRAELRERITLRRGRRRGRGARRRADVRRRRLRRRDARARRCCCARWPPARCPVASRLPVYEELLDEGERGLLFEPGDSRGAGRAARAPARRRRRCASACARRRPRARAPDLERAWPTSSRQVYDGLVARRHDRRGRPGDPRAAGRAPTADRRRPAHAHRPLARLRDAGRGAAGHRPRAGPGRDRRHRPQRDLRRARGSREGGRLRRQGDRRPRRSRPPTRARSSGCSSTRRSRAA